jgi:hypothetical protein
MFCPVEMIASRINQIIHGKKAATPVFALNQGTGLRVGSAKNFIPSSAA